MLQSRCYGGCKLCHCWLLCFSLWGKSVWCYRIIDSFSILCCCVEDSSTGDGDDEVGPFACLSRPPRRPLGYLTYSTENKVKIGADQKSSMTFPFKIRNAFYSSCFTPNGLCSLHNHFTDLRSTATLTEAFLKHFLVSEKKGKRKKANRKVCTWKKMKQKKDR